MNKGVLISITDQAALVDYPLCKCGHLAAAHDYSVSLFCEPNSQDPIKKINVHINYCLKFGVCHCMKYEEGYAN